MAFLLLLCHLLLQWSGADVLKLSSIPCVVGDVVMVPEKLSRKRKSGQVACLHEVAPGCTVLLGKGYVGTYSRYCAHAGVSCMHEFSTHRVQTLGLSCVGVV